MEDVANVIIWGNHSSTQYPDVSHGIVNINGTATSIPDAVKDDGYLQGEFITVSCIKFIRILFNFLFNHLHNCHFIFQFLKNKFVEYVNEAPQTGVFKND